MPTMTITLTPYRQIQAASLDLSGGKMQPVHDGSLFSSTNVHSVDRSKLKSTFSRNYSFILLAHAKLLAASMLRECDHTDEQLLITCKAEFNRIDVLDSVSLTISHPKIFYADEFSVNSQFFIPTGFSTSDEILNPTETRTKISTIYSRDIFDRPQITWIFIPSTHSIGELVNSLEQEFFEAHAKCVAMLSDHMDDELAFIAHERQISSNNQYRLKELNLLEFFEAMQPNAQEFIFSDNSAKNFVDTRNLVREICSSLGLGDLRVSKNKEHGAIFLKNLPRESALLIESALRQRFFLGKVCFKQTAIDVEAPPEFCVKINFHELFPHLELEGATTTAGPAT